MTKRATGKLTAGSVSKGRLTVGRDASAEVLSAASSLAPRNVIPWVGYFWGDDAQYSGGLMTTWADQITGYTLTAIPGKEPFEPRGMAYGSVTAPYFRIVRNAAENAWQSVSGASNAAAIRAGTMHDLTVHIVLYQHNEVGGYDRSEPLYIGDDSVNVAKWVIGTPTTTDLTECGFYQNGAWKEFPLAPESGRLRHLTFTASAAQPAIDLFVDGAYHSTSGTFVPDVSILDYISVGLFGFEGATGAPTEGYIFAVGIADRRSSAEEIASLFALERAAMGLTTTDYVWTPWTEASAGHHLYQNGRRHRYDTAISRERVKQWSTNRTGGSANPSAGTIATWPRLLDGVGEDMNGRPPAEFSSGGEATKLTANDNLSAWRDNTSGRGWHYTAAWIRCEAGDITSTSALGYEGNVIIGEGNGVWALSCYSADGFKWVRAYMWDGASRTVRVKLTEGAEHFVEWWKDSAGVMHLRIDGASTAAPSDSYQSIAVGNYVAGNSAVTIGNGTGGAAGTQWKGKLGALENYPTYDATVIAKVRAYFAIETGITL